jgi:hypothetical protein
MDEEQNQQKISLPEIIILTLIFGGADLFEIIATFLLAVPILDVIIIIVVLNKLVDVFCWITLIIWSILRPGIKNIQNFVTGALELIDGLDALPLRTISFFVTVFLVNRPVKMPEPLENAAGKAVELTSKTGGKTLST